MLWYLVLSVYWGTTLLLRVREQADNACLVQTAACFLLILQTVNVCAELKMKLFSIHVNILAYTNQQFANDAYRSFPLPKFTISAYKMKACNSQHNFLIPSVKQLE